MNPKNKLARVLTKGGVLTPSYLNNILYVAEKAGNDAVFFGSRQDIIFYRNQMSDSADVQENSGNVLFFDREYAYQNVISSFVCVDILPSTAWVHSGTYLNVLDQIEYKHTLRVNLVDPKQNLVPLFFGNLNFIASQTPNYWFLYLKFGEQEEAKKWPGLIFTDDIASIAVQLEKMWIKNSEITMEQLIHGLPLNFPVHTFESDEELRIPEGFFPYYEGLNKNENNETFWAGFYWRNNRYPIQFLREVCLLCLQTGLGKICITPWKTFLIKGIAPEHKIFWEALIGHYGINMRHSSFELNWHLPLLDKEAYNLKKFIVSRFDQFDIRTFGISFTIQTKPMELFTNVVIKVEGRLKFPVWMDIFRTYSIYYAYDFNPNSSQYLLFEQNISKNDLPQKLNELTKRYYIQLSNPGREAWVKLTNPKKSKSFVVHQCKNCSTVYDERFGDVLAGIQAGTPFSMLPEEYKCQLCESPKSDFEKHLVAEVIG